jgi:hypothetical protein
MRYNVRILFCLWTIQAFAAFNLTWGTPAIGLDSNPPVGDTDNNATIAMDAMGNAVATWSRTTGGSLSEHVWSAVYNHSLRVWTGALKISGEGSAANPHLAIDPAGNAILVWEEGFPSQIFCRMLSSEGVWTPDLSMPPISVSASKNSQTLPQISIDKEGNALAIWTELFEGKNHVYSARKPAGRNWIQLGKISLGTQNAQLIPSKALAINRSGQGIAVWQEQGAAHSEIHGAYYVDGAWSNPLLISQIDKNAVAPSADIDTEGNVVIVWNQDHQILSKTIRQNTLSLEPLLVSNPDYFAARPHVGIDGEGNAVVVFERYNAIHKFIAASTLSKEAGVWTAPIDISAPSPVEIATAGYPVFCMNSIGDGVAIWKESIPNRVIQGAGYSLGTWSIIKTLSSPDGQAGSTDPSYDIAVTLNEAGNILAIWPEDPNQTGAQQIKATAGAGLANRGPLPPLADPLTVMSGVVSGMQVLHRFPAHADLINIISWTSPGNVDHFNIYRGKLSSLIATTKETHYEDHQRTPNQEETYLITSVDRHGQESGPIAILVKP